MEMNKFLQHFAEQFDDVNADSLTSDTKFRELEEWSSMLALVIIAMVDEKYQAKLTGDEIKNSQTVGDLYAIVKAKL